MEPNKFFSVPTGDIAAGNSRTLSSNKSSKAFIKEKKLPAKKNAVKEVSQLPPFYDELHFANYE